VGDTTVWQVWAAVPVGALAEGGRATGATLATALDGAWRVVGEQRAGLDAPARDSAAQLVVGYRLAVPPTARGVRVDALGRSGERAAKGLVDVAPLAARGFTASDVLVVAAARGPAGADGAVRWAELALTPLPATGAARGVPVELVWEVYGAQVAAGVARLRVAVRAARVEPGGLRGVAARVVGGVRGAVVGRAAEGDVAVTYERTVAAPAGAAVVPVVLEQLRLDLGRVAAGRYRLTVTVTDLVAGATVERTSDVPLR
jgi:hypothetical protein